MRQYQAQSHQLKLLQQNQDPKWMHSQSNGCSVQKSLINLKFMFQIWQSIVQHWGFCQHFRMEVLQHDYACTASYMLSGNPFYQIMLSVVVYVPQYGISRYPPSIALLCPIIAGFSSQGALPMVFDNTVATLASNKSTWAGYMMTNWWKHRSAQLRIHVTLQPLDSFSN